MNNSSKENEGQSWCARYWWVVGMVLGIVGLCLAGALLLGLIGGTHASQTPTNNESGKVSSALTVSGKTNTN